MSTRFDYVKYDAVATEMQSNARALVINVDVLIKEIRQEILRSCKMRPVDKISRLSRRANAYLDRAVDSLEVSYAMLGKGIRDSQLLRDGEEASRD